MPVRCPAIGKLYSQVVSSTCDPARISAVVAEFLQSLRISAIVKVMAATPANPAKKPDTPAHQASSDNKYLMLGFVVLTVALVTYAIDILSVIGPEVIKDIGTTDGVIDLGATLLLATAGGLVLLVGQAGDKFSHKKVFMWGSGLMVIGGLIASFPVNGEMLLAGRFVIGAATVAFAVPCAGFLNLKFPVGDAHRGLAFGLFASGFGFGFVLAPILGGLLGWHIASLVVPVLAVVCALGISRTVQSCPAQNQNTKLDLTGSMLVLGAMVFLIVFLNEASTYGWITATPAQKIDTLGLSIPFLLGVLSIILWVAFFGYERKLHNQKRDGILVFALFKNKTFAIGLIACFLFFLGSFAAILVIPQFFLLALGFDTLVLGLSVLPVGIGIMVFGYLAGPLGDKLGAIHTVMLGFLTMAIGALALIPFLRPDSTGWLTAIPLLVFGSGFGLVYARISQTVLSGVPPAHAGLGSGTMFGIRMLGGAFGAVVLTVALTLTAADQAKDEISDQAKGLSTAQVTELNGLVDRGAALRQEAGGMNQIATDGKSYQDLLQDEELKPALADIAESFSFGFRIVMILVALISLMGILITWRLPKGVAT